MKGEGTTEEKVETTEDPIGVGGLFENLKVIGIQSWCVTPELIPGGPGRSTHGGHSRGGGPDRVPDLDVFGVTSRHPSPLLAPRVDGKTSTPGTLCL